MYGSSEGVIIQILFLFKKDNGKSRVKSKVQVAVKE